MEQIMALVSRANILLIFVFISTFINQKTNHQKKNNLHQYEILHGVIFCVFILIDTTHPFVSQDGFTYDAREILLNLSALVYGPLTATITVIFTFILWWASGKRGTDLALMGLVIIYLAEILIIYSSKRKYKKMNEKPVLKLSIFTNMISGMSLIITSGSEWKKVLVSVITITIAYPFFTLIAFRIMNYIENSEDLVGELSKRDKILLLKNQQLEHANEELRRNELRFRTIFYHSSEAVFLIRRDKMRISDLNIEAMQLLGLHKKDDALGKTIFRFMPKEQKDKITSRRYIHQIFEKIGDGRALQKEVFILTDEGVELLLEGVFIEIELMDQKYVYMSARDIRERKRKEEEMLYKSQIDALTQVANRQYFNEVLKQMVASEINYPLAFVMADVNGLKIVNDIFGHSKGDQLIIRIAQVLTHSCRSQDIVARVGGDEFIILFPNATAKTVQSIIDRIKDNLIKEKIETMTPSLAIGYAVKEDIHTKIDEILNQADEMMYANKQSHRQANAKIFLDNLVEKLYTISPDEQRQAEALYGLFDPNNLCDHMTPLCTKEIELLIKYINLGKLITGQEDWKIKGDRVENLEFSTTLMGNSYTLLRNIGELNSLAISEHLVNINEKWDGSGRMKMKGEEIPLALRSFRLLFDYFYLNQHANQFGHQGPVDIIQAMKSQTGKKYDPALFARFEQGVLGKSVDI